MFKVIIEFFSLLTPGQRKRFFVFQILIIIMTFAEIVGIASIIPLMAIAGDPSILERENLLAMLYLKSNIGDPYDFIVYLGNKKKIGDIDSLIIDYGDFGNIDFVLHRESNEKPEGVSLIPISANNMLCRYINSKGISTEMLFKRIYSIPYNVSLLIKNYEKKNK